MLVILPNLWYNKRKGKKEIKWAMRQQGGKNEGLDDYISSGSYSTLLLNHPLAKSLEVF